MESLFATLLSLSEFLVVITALSFATEGLLTMVVLLAKSSRILEKGGLLLLLKLVLHHHCKDGHDDDVIQMAQIMITIGGRV